MRFISPQWRPSLAKRRAPLRSIIDVSAFASIMLVLLFLFMAPSLVIQHPKHVPVDLPLSTHAPLKPDALRDDALIVAITRDGLVYFRNMRVPREELPEAIQELIRSGSEKTVYISADARARYLDIETVINQIRVAGVTNITFLAESSRP